MNISSRKPEIASYTKVRQEIGLKVHSDFKSHTGATLTMVKGAIISV